jgi:hypothetical protein
MWPVGLLLKYIKRYITAKLYIADVLTSKVKVTLLKALSE